MYFFSTLLFSLALSIDGLGVGLAYGLKQIQIPLTSLLIMCGCAMSAILVSMMAGQGIAHYFSPETATRLGAFALIGVGLWYLAQGYLKAEVKETVPPKEHPDIITSFRLRPFNIIVQIMSEPSRADMDSSGSIASDEALLLGITLALDGLGSGIAAAMASFNIFLTMLMVGICEFLTVSLGLYLGARLPEKYFKPYANAIAGFVLCFLGIYRL